MNHAEKNFHGASAAHQLQPGNVPAEALRPLRERVARLRAEDPQNPAIPELDAMIQRLETAHGPRRS